MAGTRSTLRTAGLLGSPGRVTELEAGETARIGDLRVATAAVSHDAADPVGFRIEAGRRRLGFALDLGKGTGAVQDLLAGCEALILEANHDREMLEQGPYPRDLKERLKGPRGHLSNAEAAEILAEVAGPSTRTLVLAHLSRTNNRPELALSAARSALARRRCGAEVVVAEQGPARRWIEV